MPEILPANGWNTTIAVLMLSLSLSALGGITSAADTTAIDTDTLSEVQRQIDKIKSNESAERRRVEQDELLIRKLEQHLEHLESQNAALANHSRGLEVTNDRLKADTTRRLQDLQEQLAKGLTAAQFGSSMDRYLVS